MTIQDQKTRIEDFVREIGKRCNVEFEQFTTCEKARYPALEIDRVGDVEFRAYQNKEMLQYTYLVTLYFGFKDISDFESLMDCLLCSLMKANLDTFFGAKTTLHDKRGNRGVMVDDQYLFDNCDREAQTIQFFIKILDKPCL